MSYEVRRDVEVEVVDESDGVLRESSYVVDGLPSGYCGPMPQFTEEELRAGLGKEWRDRLRRVLGAAAIDTE